jgi:hypothetical protein
MDKNTPVRGTFRSIDTKKIIRIYSIGNSQEFAGVDVLIVRTKVFMQVRRIENNAIRGLYNRSLDLPQKRISQTATLSRWHPRASRPGISNVGHPFNARFIF